MTLKTLSRNFFKKEFKRNIWLLGIGCFLLFIVYPLALLQNVVTFESQYGVSFQKPGDLYIKNKVALMYQLGYTATAVYMVIGVLALLNGVMIYRYIHSRQKLDFYFSQPISKSTLFWTGYFQGIINFVIPYIINVVFLLLIGMTQNCITGPFVGMMIQGFLINVLFYLVLYTLFIVACVLTGTILFSVLGSFILIGIFPTISYIIDQILRGQSEYIIHNLSNLLIRLSPYGLLIDIMEKFQDLIIYNGKVGNVLELHHYDLKGVIGLITYFIVLVPTARMLFVKRPSEAAGKTIIFPLAQKIIKQVLLFAFTLMAMYIIPEFFETHGIVLQVIAFIVGVTIGLYILDSIMELSWKAFFANWKKNIIYIVITLVATVSLFSYCEVKRYKAFDGKQENYTIEEAATNEIVYKVELQNEKGFVYGYELANEDAFNKFMADTKDGKDAVLHCGYLEYISNGIGDERRNIVHSHDIVYRGGKYYYYSRYCPYASIGYSYLVKMIEEKDDSGEENIEQLEYVLTDKKDYDYMDESFHVAHVDVFGY